MSLLADYKLEYEDLPPKARKGGKDSKMSKSTNTSEPKSSKRYNKTRGEHLKDLVIVVLVAGILAFIAGMQFANGHNAEVKSAVSQAQTANTVDTSTKK